jgi:uncharacterized membrane protein
MYTYHFIQWVFFFFIYCFLGWIWESAFVSIRDRRFTNRGFMYGPLLPIYGSGAICILLATLPVRDNPVLIFLFGSIAASILEYFTGAVMEALFKMRYWDYSKQKFNLNGYICLKCSIVWGLFSVLMVNVLHKPIESFVLAIHEQVLHAIVYFLTIAATADFVVSLQNAFDLRDMLESMTEMKEDVARMQRRLDVVIAFLNEDKKIVSEKIDSGKERLEESIGKQHQRAMVLQNEIGKRLHAHSLKNAAAPEGHSVEKMEAWKEELVQMGNRFSEYKAKLHLSKKRNRRFRSVLSGNPTAMSLKYKKALEELKEAVK